jgi:hypothetical protein
MVRPLAVPLQRWNRRVFLIFLFREDLRTGSRLLGTEDLERTTAALDDAGERLGVVPGRNRS